MNRLTTALTLVTLLIGATACEATGERKPAPEPKVEIGEPPAPPPLVVIEEFGPLAFSIAPDLRAEWDRVLELHQRLFTKQEQQVEEDDLHRLYNQADANDDDVLDRAEVDEAFRRAKREYERYLERRN